MELQDAIAGFLFHCQYEKNLSPKTLKAYSIDLRQFSEFLARELQLTTLDKIDKVPLRAYIKTLFGPLKEKSIKRKVATLKAFFRHLEREDEIAVSPFRKMDVRIKEARRLPRTVSLDKLEKLFRHLYLERIRSASRESADHACLVRDICVLEMLFFTGARVSEICGLNRKDIDLNSGVVRILGKGRRERLLAAAPPEAIPLLSEYFRMLAGAPSVGAQLFSNRLGRRLSEQSVRSLLRRHARNAELDCSLTPHMLRHTLATALLEAGVDIRYIQKQLGHAAITTTQIYTEVRALHQQQIVSRGHPRLRFPSVLRHAPLP